MTHSSTEGASRGGVWRLWLLCAAGLTLTVPVMGQACLGPSPSKAIGFLGDSKTDKALNTWPQSLVTSLNATTGSLWMGWNGARSSTTVAHWVANPTWITQSATMMPTDIVMLNLGANDMAGGMVEAAWKADLTTLLDTIHGYFPLALVYVTLPWRRGYETEATNFAAWITAVVATRAFARLSDDERVWLKGSDNGVTMTVDGVHYSTTGEATAWSVKKTALGY